MEQAKSANNNPTILVIDDEEVVRLLFESLLEEEGYPTLMADSGRRGIELLEKHKPPLALVDKNLPDISGLDLIAEQKKLHPTTEFIMITGYASLDSAIKAMEMGAFSYLTKPFSDMEMVLDRIRAALEVNTLRFETSILRDRLSSIASDPDPDPATVRDGLLKRAAADSTLPAEMRQQVEHTAAFLESFIAKRDTPPSDSIWARTVDMAEEESRKLRALLEPKTDDAE